MIPEIDVRQLAAAHRDDALVVDVREPLGYRQGHVPGALLIPLREVRSRLAELPKDGPVYVICASGNRSVAATRWMVAAGIDARSVAGGTSAWMRSGGPIVRGSHANAA